MLTLEQKRVVAEAISGGADIITHTFGIDIYANDFGKWSPEQDTKQWKALVRLIADKTRDLIKVDAPEIDKQIDEFYGAFHVAIANDDVDALEQIAFELVGHE